MLQCQTSKMKFILIFSLLAPLEAKAEEVKLFFFGGYRTTPEIMRCWEEGARRKFPGTYNFEGIAFPAGSGSDSAIKEASGEIRRIVEEINAHPENRYIIVGHSSGAAISNRVAEQAAKPGRLKLFDLDGFAAGAALRKKIPSTECWASENQAGLHSRNYSAMATCGEKMRVYQDNHCKTALCLHVALFVKNAPADMGHDPTLPRLASCDSNMDWLK